MKSGLVKSNFEKLWTPKFTSTEGGYKVRIVSSCCIIHCGSKLTGEVDQRNSHRLAQEQASESRTWNQTGAPGSDMSMGICCIDFHWFPHLSHSVCHEEWWNLCVQIHADPASLKLVSLRESIEKSWKNTGHSAAKADLTVWWEPTSAASRSGEMDMSLRSSQARWGTREVGWCSMKKYDVFQDVKNACS